MSATPSPTGHAVEAEHQVIKKLLATIEGQPDLSQVREVVARFCTMLPQHFKEEEAPNGLYEDLRAVRPSMANAIRTLTADHVALNAELQALCDAVSAADAALNVMWAAKDQFVGHLITHEATESGLVMDAYTIDLGSGD